VTKCTGSTSNTALSTSYPRWWRSDKEV
jgi:hypothetical protein